MCGGTQLRRLSTNGSHSAFLGNERRLSITKSSIKAIHDSLADQESINSKVDSVQQQINALQKESKVAQLDFQKQIEKMYKEWCAERLAKITELKSRLSSLQALKKKEKEEATEVVMIMPNTLKRSRPVSSVSSTSSSASSKKNEDFKIQKTEDNSSVFPSKNRFLEHTRSVCGGRKYGKVLNSLSIHLIFIFKTNDYKFIKLGSSSSSTVHHEFAKVIFCLFFVNLLEYHSSSVSFVDSSHA